MVPITRTNINRRILIESLVDRLNPKWQKSSIELEELLDIMLNFHNVTKRRMFSSQAYFANGNMFVGVFEDTIFLRLPEKDRELIKDQYNDIEHFEPLEGKKMREYLVINDQIFGNIPEFEKWLDKSYQYASKIPPKKRKK